MDLATYCAELAANCSQSQTWVSQNTDLVRNEQEGLNKELRRAGRLFRRLERAASRKMCAGVFGPSQAGKSYLISALARDKQGNLLASFGSQKHDFIQEINPEGGKESTGLVTRFTLTKPTNLPATHPVQVNLLTETDLVKILANTYFADCEHKEDNVSDIDATLGNLATRPKVQSKIDLDALEDLREYLRDFRSKARVMILESQFWDKAISLGPNLDLEGRIALYGLIWDEVPEFTSLLRILLKALESLGHPEVLYCPIEALIPRTGSIIDVATLAGLESLCSIQGQSASANQDSKADDLAQSKLEVLTSNGQRAILPRCVVTALTAELTIVMEEPPAEYFNYTDLLDFPGYRSRYKIENVRQELVKPGLLKEMFLRGKVAYLFQRYCTERELTSMLLCIGPSNQEVQDLPGVINDWVGQTHGQTPALRQGRAVSLFFILTKFDMEFEQKKGAPSVETRWDNRLHASLLDFFGKQHDWPSHWDESQGFRNMFFLRNPNFRFDAILNYDQSGRELGIRAEMTNYVDALHKAFLASQLVAKHFKDPAQAWDAAMRLNDGGITYIREALNPLCNPQIKTTQLTATVKVVCEQLDRRLKAFYRTNDSELLLKQKFALARTIGRYLGELEKEYQRLGLLLRALTISDVEIFELYPEAFRRFLAKPEEEVVETKAVAEPEDLDLVDFNFDDWNPLSGNDKAKKDTENASSGPVKVYARDEAAFFAEYIESSWIAKLHALADDPSMQTLYHLPGREFSAFVSELATGAVRFDLRGKMIAEFHKVAEYVNTQKESIVWQEAAIAAHLINSYVDWLGYDPRADQENAREVRIGNRSVAVFPDKPEVLGLVKLAESREEHAGRYFYDWLNAFIGLVLGNVSFDGEQEINWEENAKLERILKKFEQIGTGS